MIAFFAWFSSLVRTVTSLVSWFVTLLLTLNIFSDLIPCSFSCSSIVSRLTSSKIFVITKHAVTFSRLLLLLEITLLCTFATLV